MGEVWGERKARVCFKSGMKGKAVSACTYIGEE